MGCVSLGTLGRELFREAAEALMHSSTTEKRDCLEVPEETLPFTYR